MDENVGNDDDTTMDIDDAAMDIDDNTSIDAASVDVPPASPSLSPSSRPASPLEEAAETNDDNSGSLGLFGIPLEVPPEEERALKVLPEGHAMMGELDGDWWENFEFTQSALEDVQALPSGDEFDSMMSNFIASLPPADPFLASVLPAHPPFAPAIPAHPLPAQVVSAVPFVSPEALLPPPASSTALVPLNEQPPLTAPSNVPATSSVPQPDWFRTAKTYLEDKTLGDDWSAAVKMWVDLETMLEFGVIRIMVRFLPYP